MKKLRTLEHWLLSAEKALLIGFVLVMVCLSFTQVLLRGFFSGGFLWADTFLRHLVLWVGFLGAAVAAGENKQFAMDAATRFFEGRVKSTVEAIASLFTVGVCAVMTHASWAFFLDEKASGNALFSIGAHIHIPSWTVGIILPVGFALIAVHYTIKAAISIMELRKS